jgi:L-alanine-DL-glutamate epimerase-like enolase superfamily enzyme
MKINKVEVIPFGSPIKNFADAYAEVSTSNAILVKIYTDEGIIGYGEACAWQAEFYGETLESVSYALQKYITPKIIGQNPLNINRILSIVDASFAKATCAKEGVDLALFDLAGRILKVPVYTLLNGCFRDQIPIACEIGINKPDIMAQDAMALLKKGVKVIKLKGSPEVEEDVKRIKTVREAVGNEAVLRLDPNAHWCTHETIKAMREVEDCSLQLLEQPVPGWDLKGMAHIRKSIGIPLMADEGIWTPQDVVAIAEHGAADIINIKIAKTGGLFLAKKVEAVAEAEGLPCMVGTEIEPGFSLAAKLHLAASMKNLPFACEFTELSLLQKQILNPKIKIENGNVKVPQGIGLGFELDEQVFSECTIDLEENI